MQTFQSAVTSSDLRATPARVVISEQIWFFYIPIIIILIFFLTVSAEAGYAASGGNEVYTERARSTVLRQLSFMGIGAAGLFWLVSPLPKRRQVQVTWTILLPIIALASLLLSSVLWSDDPEMTFKRSITAILLFFAGLGLGRIWSLRDYAWAVLLCSSLVLLFSIAAELWYRSFLTNDDYRFSGMIHPNKQAFNCGFLLLSGLAIYITEQRKWILILVGLALICLILTKTRSGTIGAVICVGWLLYHYWSVRKWMPAVVAMAAIGCATFFLWQSTGTKRFDATKVMTMGRDIETADPAKLTGRLPIWKQAWGEFSKRPIFGHGYGAFWTTRRLADFERNNGWALYHAHSAYLEVLINIGISGLLLGMLVICMVYHRSVQLYRSGVAIAPLITSLIIFGLIGGITETAFIHLQYVSLISMTGIGVIVFSKLPEVEVTG
jgi:exopolysaccharide production protein ExoQ